MIHQVFQDGFLSFFERSWQGTYAHGVGLMKWVRVERIFTKTFIFYLMFNKKLFKTDSSLRKMFVKHVFKKY